VGGTSWDATTGDKTDEMNSVTSGCGQTMQGKKNGDEIVTAILQTLFLLHFY
jgi:hypothetical protein